MTYFKLGDGKYCVASGRVITTGTPCLTIRRLPKKQPTGKLLDVTGIPRDDYELLIEVATPAAAAVLLVQAQSIAFAHGIKQEDK